MATEKYSSTRAGGKRLLWFIVLSPIILLIVLIALGVFWRRGNQSAPGADAPQTNAIPGTPAR